MLRNIDLNEISDGNLYTANDLVRADCGGCHAARIVVRVWETPSSSIPMIFISFARLKPRP